MQEGRVMSIENNVKTQESKLSYLLLSINRPVILIYGLFFLSSILMVTMFSKSSLHLILNKFHFWFLDYFFKYATYLGDGIMFGVLVLVFLFIKKRMALVFGVSGILTLIITHVLKKIVFAGMPRPVGVIGEDKLHLVEGIKIAFWNTFPSGHTTTAFAIFTILCLYFRKCTSQYLWIGLALVAGISRVYLSQHFWIDIFVGSVLGILIAFISMGLFFPKRNCISKC